ncbi:uncharacterized oxidoreductase mb1385 [Phtheirospermum japonicum]|uniref:Uncharacterized oxidoreductase mb1385 n=1 Tax=Phtheirospermum japonicum TaxID=374723 RepID=A0A830C404_9LAMI|nr:uncharacterized oxidoreductase mb1385 [Phtheirospermum japonicum]
MDASKHDEHGHFDRVVAVELDITGDNKTIDGAVQKAWDAFGHIDALVNNAGIRGEVKSSLELSEEEWDRVMKTNLKGSWLVSKCVGTRMRSSGRGGSIVNISSGAGLNRVQFHGAVAYSPSKAAMDAMTRVMALELGKYKIRVNSIAPGLFESEITEHLFQQVWLKDLATKITPMGAILTSDPGLTSLIRYLLHDSSSYVTGNVFIVDAGYTLPGVPIFSSL